MSYKIVKKDKANYSTSAWSGGATTEIQIMPEGSRYADREFLWRLSSATVEVEESTFTALPDYDRLIMMLEGEMDLCHNNGPWAVAGVNRRSSSFWSIFWRRRAA